MPRILPPPTRYDPLRIVQRRAAAAVRTILIPPTRFGAPIQHRGPAGVIQRAAALETGTGGGGAAAGDMAKTPEGVAKPGPNDTLAMKFARTLSGAEADKWLNAAIAVIGSDKKEYSPLRDHIVSNKADSLSMRLVHRSDGVHTNKKNLDWLKLCVAAKKQVVVLNPGTVGMGSFVTKKTEAQLLAANPIKTEHEAGYLLTCNYVWDAPSGKLIPPK